VRGFAALRGGYGAVLLSVPDRVIVMVTVQRPDPATRAVARVLGVRHVLQALATCGRPGSLVLALGAEADLAHAASMLVLGVVDPRRRRAALADGLVASCLAATGVWLARRDRRPPPYRGGLGPTGGETRGGAAVAGLATAREETAARVARWALPGALRRWVAGR